MATPRPSDTRSPRALLHVGGGHPAARRYTLARRNALPRAEAVVAVHGRWGHETVLRADARVETSLWCPPALGRQSEAAMTDLVARVVQRADTAYEISPRTLTRLHPGLTAPALLSVVRLPSWDVADLVGPGSHLLLVADGITYAGNLGTLIRIADGSGADGLLLTSSVARLTHPQVFNASRGTVLTTPIVVLATVPEAKHALTRAGFTTYLADPDATSSYTRQPRSVSRVAFVVGSEAAGVSSEWRDPALPRLAIPMAGHADSLNVAVSAAILMYDARWRLA